MEEVLLDGILVKMLYLMVMWILAPIQKLIIHGIEEDGEETVGSMNWRTLLKNNYILKETLYDIAKEFLENYNGPEPIVS